MKRLRLWWVLLFPWWVGCQTLPDTSAFEVSLVDLRPGEVTGWETTAFCTVRLQNSSPDPIRLEGAAHKIYLNGAYVGQGLSSEAVEVPRLGTATQVVTVHLKNFTLARKLYRSSQTLQASYRIQSTLYAASGGSRQTIRTSKEGSIDLTEFTGSRSGVTP